MKLSVAIFLAMMLGASMHTYAQTTASQTLPSQSAQTEVTLFAQCMFSIPDQADLNQLQNDLMSHPNIQMVRLDWHTQRSLILTQGTQQLSEDEFRSWFGQYASTVECIQIGVYGVDTMNPYPFTNCQ